MTVPTIDATSSGFVPFVSVSGNQVKAAFVFDIAMGRGDPSAYSSVLGSLPSGQGVVYEHAHQRHSRALRALLRDAEARSKDEPSLDGGSSWLSTATSAQVEDHLLQELKRRGVRDADLTPIQLANVTQAARRFVEAIAQLKESVADFDRAVKREALQLERDLAEILGTTTKDPTTGETKSGTARRFRGPPGTSSR